MKWQSRLRCAWFNEHTRHCTHPLTEGWVIDMQWAADPAAVFATYTQPEPMTPLARHAAPRVTLMDKLRTWWNHLWSRNV